MSKRLSGRHIVLTAGPTLEPIDPVRFLSNRSSGKQGYALAHALAGLGAKVTLVSGPTALDDPAGTTTIRVETAVEMLAAVRQALPADVFIAVAAVADWRPAQRSQTKLKLDKSNYASLQLVENPDILKTIGHLPAHRPSLVIGFAAETHNVEKFGAAKLARKGCDWIIANDVSGDVMGGDHNAICLITNTSIDRWPRASKIDVAQKLAHNIADFYE
jgi:phosphopantothenoylcysteine decarboxylase/phosphopantothenate--cysteine ligase